uniref:uncharacterized protein LOC122583623 n=1 Tax=Erigeron canadensis TaxID=72917 RepID=UPI001CB897D1|nr:uncharacterized protein LOC122583623 [Erigeron canadensis]
MNPFFNNPLFLDNHGPTPPNFQSDSSSSDETERYSNLFTMAHYAIQQDVRDTASSSRTYTRRDDRGESHNRLFRDYFAEEPKFNETFFRQRFRMSRRLFVKIASDLENNFSFFQRKIDARGKWGFSALQRCTSAVRQLGYGSNPDSLDDYLNMSERSSRDTLNAFCDGVIKLYRHEYLRRPTLPVFLVDGIYPRYAMFVKTISHPTGEKRIRYAKAQEAARKDVERAFDEDHAISPDYIPDPPVAPQPSDERLFEIQNPNVHEDLKMDLIDHIHCTFIPGIDR